MGKYLLFHRHHVVKLLLWIGMEGGDIHYVIECASCCSQCCFQVFKSKPHPVVGWIILASDVSQIAYRTVRDYNRIARGSDKIW